MKELELPAQDPLPVEAKQHLSKKVGRPIRIPIGAKLFGYNITTGECDEVRKELTKQSIEKRVMNGVTHMEDLKFLHHKVTYSSEIIYVIAINQANAIRKGEKTKKRLLMSRSQ